MKFRKIIAMLLAAAVCLTGCGDNLGSGSEVYSREESLKELDAYWNEIKPVELKAPLDIYEDSEESVTLADIDTFPLVVEGRGQINIEVAAATEMSSKAPDDWMVTAAERFNAGKNEVNGRSVSVSVRKITSGEVVTYMEDGGYRPDVYAPSNSAKVHATPALRKRSK